MNLRSVYENARNEVSSKIWPLIILNLVGHGPLQERQKDRKR
jgi:hypothetical protein